jgi:hypothetical protein
MRSQSGGIDVLESEGYGVDAEDFNAQKDISISSGSKSQKSREAEHSELFLAAAGLNVGGSISIQQFVGENVSLAQQLAFFAKEIGIGSDRNFRDSQFQAYCDAWRSLQKLRLTGDELWARVTEDNIVKFANLLRETRHLVWDSEIFFEDRDRRDLEIVLEKLSDFRLGKFELLQIRSKKDIEHAQEKRYVRENITELVARQIEYNRVAKLAYEGTLENIRKSFHQKLSKQN